MAKNRKENKQIKFRVSDQEHDRLELMSSQIGKSIPAFCKSKAMGIKIKSPKIDHDGALKIMSELRRIGTNVNQIAKHLNSFESVNQLEIDEVEKELTKIWQLLNSEIQK
jgi:hypothetical protein